MQIVLIFPYRRDPIVRITVPPRYEKGPPRQHPKQPHPPEVVAEARRLVETTGQTLREIAQHVGVDSGTVSRWAEKHGWTRPRGAWPFRRRPERRYVPVLAGRVLAQRLRVQAERLIREIEAAPTVDPAALAEAQRLLAQAREEQKERRFKTRVPPPPPPPDERDPPRRKHSRHDRAAAALKGWKGRYSKLNRHHAWMLEKIDP